MMRRDPAAYVFTLVASLACSVASESVTFAQPGSVAPATAAAGRLREQIAVNDNRQPAGRLDGNTLTVSLEARLGEWFPDGAGTTGIVVNAFAADNGPLQTPGPLIRVPHNTQVRIRIRNAVHDRSLTMHGLYARASDAASAAAAANVVVVPAGESREVVFIADRVGTYFYWGATHDAPLIEQRRSVDTQLTGALVVDPPGGTAASDRILFISSWDNDEPLNSPARRFRFAINGHSWPKTERLSYNVGEPARMRVINGGGGVHPMHLHGFYFKVDSRGNESRDTIFDPASSPRLVVTERLVPGTSFSLTWTPTRPGNWLFHCHDNVHLDHGGAVDGGPAQVTHRHSENHLDNMAGPVIGISVTGRSLEAPEPTTERRRLRLVARVDTGGTAQEPAYGYALDSGAGSSEAAASLLPGPLLLLKRGEPVSITVDNQLPEPTAVHWHGIELESYYDGVAGFAGEGERVAPAIAPGGSFEARFTPPRSGTFMYHTHLDDTRQQQAGLTGPLIVVDDPASYDPQHDIVLLVTVPRKTADSDVVLINGSSTPAGREMRVGERYRLRFINLHVFRPSMRMRLLRESSLQRWRAVAKDGMDLPSDRAIDGAAEVQMGNGESYDFEFVPEAAGELRLDVTTGNGILLSSMPIRVR